MGLLASDYVRSDNNIISSVLINGQNSGAVTAAHSVCSVCDVSDSTSDHILTTTPLKPPVTDAG